MEVNCMAVVRISGRLAQRAGSAVVSIGDRDGGCGPVSLSGGRLCERERDHAHGQQQKQVKRALNKMRFGREAYVCGYLALRCVNIFYSKRVGDVETFRRWTLTRQR